MSPAVWGIWCNYRQERLEHRYTAPANENEPFVSRCNSCKQMVEIVYVDDNWNNYGVCCAEGKDNVNQPI